MTIYDARAGRRIRPTLRLRLTLLNGVLLVGVATLLVILAWLLVGDVLASATGLRPGSRVQQATTTAQHLTGETLDQRIRYVGADDEVAELAATFDAMLDRINEAFETQKRFVANASHELRTPL